MDATSHHAWQIFFMMLLAMLMLSAYTGKPRLKQMGLVEPIILILLWLAGQR